MSPSRNLLHGEITYEEAIESRSNILHQLQYPEERRKFYYLVDKHRHLIQERVAHHLGIRSPSACRIEEPTTWRHGSFNMCVPVTVENGRRLLIRFPLPYRIGDKAHPGNGDEKLRCEAATYALFQERCPEVRVPHLYGFALSTGQTFTAVQHLPLFDRVKHHIRCRLRSWLGYPVPSKYVQQPTSISSAIGGYLLLEYIDERDGQMLSSTWEAGRANPKLRQNLYRGISRILLSLAQQSFHKIGSLTINDEGFVRLENRPLTMDIQMSENEGIPVPIPRSRTYSTVDSYVNDVLRCHDNRLRYQPNAAQSASDCATQMSALASMRTVRPVFFEERDNWGPFSPCLTDFHQSNLIVDSEWNIKGLLDLEWTAVLPSAFLQPPYWLTDELEDMITTETHNGQREEFMESVKQEEISLHPRRLLSPAMNRSWEIGTFWYILALQKPPALPDIYYHRIQPCFSNEHRDDNEFYYKTYPYWTRDAQDFITLKVKHWMDFEAELLQAFTHS